MAEPVLFLCWEDHITELSTVYKSLLENDFLVDCTISAEGQSLKAHRLVLSACSPYFHMLFREETEKHPFVILLNASFETLKAVIDFVYRGETHIPQSNLKAFLTLAQALKIKGLNAFSEDDMSKNLPGNPSGNASHGPPEDYQDSFEVQCISAIHEDTHGNSSQQLLDSTDHYSNLAITNSSVPIVAYSVSCEEFQSSSAITTLQENQTSVEYNEDPLKTEDITLKQEPLLSPCSETRNNKADDSCGGSSHGTVESSGETLPQHLMQLSNKVSSARNVAEDHQSSEMIPKSEPVDNLESEEPMDHYDMPENDVYDTDERTGPSGGQQYFTPCPSADGLPLKDDLATQQRSLPGQQRQSSPPHTELQLQEGLHALPGEQTVLSDEGGMAVAHVPRTNTRKRGRPRKCGIALAHLPSTSTCNRGDKSADGLPLKEDPATLGLSLPGQQRQSSPPHTELQLPEGPHAHSGEQTVLSDEDGMAVAHLPRSNTRKRGRPRKGGIALAHLPSTSTCNRGAKSRPYICDVCQKVFATPSRLSVHMRKHTGERPFRCDVCEKDFTQKINLICHKRSHTGELPYSCDVCGKRFTALSSRKLHMRIHTGERPYRCDICEKDFTQKNHLISHKRSHMGEHPYSCDVCGKRFTSLSSRELHMRVHTGERPYRCDVCEKSFMRKVTLVVHMRTHTGERPYRCDVCGERYAQSNSLRNHMRNHIGI